MGIIESKFVRTAQPTWVSAGSEFARTPTDLGQSPSEFCSDNPIGARQTSPPIFGGPGGSKPGYEQGRPRGELTRWQGWGPTLPRKATRSHAQSYKTRANCDRTCHTPLSSCHRVYLVVETCFSQCLMLLAAVWGCSLGLLLGDFLAVESTQTVEPVSICLCNILCLLD